MKKLLLIITTIIVIIFLNTAKYNAVSYYPQTIDTLDVGYPHAKTQLNTVFDTEDLSERYISKSGITPKNGAFNTITLDNNNTLMVQGEGIPGTKIVVHTRKIGESGYNQVFEYTLQATYFSFKLENPLSLSSITITDILATPFTSTVSGTFEVRVEQSLSDTYNIHRALSITAPYGEAYNPPEAIDYTSCYTNQQNPPTVQISYPTILIRCATNDSRQHNISIYSNNTLVTIQNTDTILEYINSSIFPNISYKVSDISGTVKNVKYLPNQTDFTLQKFDNLNTSDKHIKGYLISGAPYKLLSAKLYIKKYNLSGQDITIGSDVAQYKFDLIFTGQQFSFDLSPYIYGMDPNMNGITGTYKAVVEIQDLVGNKTTKSFSFVYKPAGYMQSQNYLYRFWSTEKQGHFYTASLSEKDYVQSNYTQQTWKYERIAYQVSDCTDTGSSKVYRFWSDTKQHHFYTIDEAEKNYVSANYPANVWKYEMEAFCAYKSQVTGTQPVYRFWSDEKQSHFYTISLDEKNYIIANYPTRTWKYEGIAYYAKP